MMPRKVSEIRKEHQTAGALNALLNVFSFIDEHTFLTKNGDLGVVLRVQELITNASIIPRSTHSPAALKRRCAA